MPTVEALSVATANLTKRRVDLLECLAKEQRSLTMALQRGGQHRRVEHLNDRTPIMRVVVAQPGKGHQGRPHIDVIGEEVLRLRDPKVAHPGSDHPDKSPPNLRLNIAVVPRVPGKYGWPQSAK